MWVDKAISYAKFSFCEDDGWDSQLPAVFGGAEDIFDAKGNIDTRPKG